MYGNLIYIHKDDRISLMSMQDISDQITADAVDPQADQHEILAYDVRYFIYFIIILFH